MKKLLLAIITLLWTSFSYAQYTLIPDTRFEQLLIQRGFDSGDIDGMVRTDSISKCTNLFLVNMDISDLTGIQDFVSLTYLNCHSNPLGSLDVSKNLALTRLDCSGTKLSSLDLSKNTKLQFLQCGGNSLKSLDVSENIALTDLYCVNNQLASLDVSKNTSLGSLICYDNPLRSLDVSNNISLTYFDCHGTQLTHLDVSKNIKLIELYCMYIPNLCLSILPVSISYLHTDFNICLPNLPNATFTLTGPNHKTIPKILCDETNNPNQCQTYPFPNVAGRVYIDANNDSQYTAGLDYPYINGIIQGAYNSNADSSGSFKLTYDQLNTNNSIQPILANGVTSSKPANYIVNFTSYNDRLTGKDFILNVPPTQSNINQVQVYLTPITVARPGFAIRYKVSVKNDGYELRDVNVSLNFDNHLTYTSSLPAGMLSSNTLSWIIAGLKPFAERSFNIDFVLPSNTALGTTLKSTAYTQVSITNPGQFINSNVLYQTVRGSYDPNDKIVDKGTEVLLSQVQAQQDFEYTIRFQNTGTDTAFTVVVRDTMQASTYDISTFKMLAASHAYALVVKGNVATWTFNDIHLPDSNKNKLSSNGFVKFKIKPLSTLALDSEIKNKAAIYFDYNIPVLTKTANTRITTIDGIKEEETFTSSVYPNPSKGVYIVQLNNPATLQVFNVTGQMLQEIQSTSNTTQIDISHHMPGLYFLKVMGSNQTQVKKLILE